MTPPDSDARRAGKSHLHVGKECGPSCPDSEGIEFKPDSDAREVQICGAGMRDARCRKLKYHDGAHDFDSREVVCRSFLALGEYAPIPLTLAQRILAALERDIWTELAAELRERLPK